MPCKAGFGEASLQRRWGDWKTAPRSFNISIILVGITEWRYYWFYHCIWLYNYTRRVCVHAFWSWRWSCLKLIDINWCWFVDVLTCFNQQTGADMAPLGPIGPHLAPLVQWPGERSQSGQLVSALKGRSSVTSLMSQSDQGKDLERRSWAGDVVRGDGSWSMWR